MNGPAVLFVAWLFAATAHAQSRGIGVAPVLVKIPAERGVGALRIDNGRAVATAFEVDVYRWSQANGADVLEPTREVAVAPSVFEVAPQEQQLVRIAIAPHARAGEREAAYRLLIRELPPQVRPTTGPLVLLEMSVPVFAARRNATPRLVAHDVGGGASTLANSGAAHIRLVEVGPPHAPTRDAPRYLLAGASFTRHIERTRGDLRVLTLDAAGARTQELVVPVASTVAAGDPVLRGR